MVHFVKENLFKVLHSVYTITFNFLHTSLIQLVMSKLTYFIKQNNNNTTEQKSFECYFSGTSTHLENILVSSIKLTLSNLQIFVDETFFTAIKKKENTKLVLFNRSRAHKIKSNLYHKIKDLFVNSSLNIISSLSSIIYLSQEN